MSKLIPWLANASCKMSLLHLTSCMSIDALCDRHFGPSLVPLLQVGFRGVVLTDAGFRAYITTVQNHKDTCSAATWDTMVTYAKQLRDKKIKMAFFSSTPQGGGVALMRHALVRFSRLMGVELTWYGKWARVVFRGLLYHHLLPCLK